MYNYSVALLNTDNIEEICADLLYQKENKIADCPIFSMSLYPDGTPPENKAEKYCKTYDIFKEKLDKMGVESGVLVQSTIGHGPTVNAPSPFQNVVNFKTGQKTHLYCPLDEDFREHMKNSFIEISKRNPKVIMLDDDFRLLGRAEKGCACPLHMKRFNELAGTSLSREELFDIISNKKENHEKYYKLYVQTQKESLVGLAEKMREGIDCVNPDIQGAVCTCGGEFEADIAQALAGKSNTPIIRLASGNYTTQSFHWFSIPMTNAAMQKCSYKGMDIKMLAETDTCPHNRYSKGAQPLHAHFTGLLMEGVSGAKHWISNLKPYEKLSSKAYEKILKKYSGFYEKVEELVKDVTPFGCNCPVPPRPSYEIENYNCITDAKYNTLGWSACVLERLGLPMYFSSNPSGISFFDGNKPIAFTNDEMLAFFKGTVVLSSDSCQILNDRGLLEYTGVEVREWDKKVISGEFLINEGFSIPRQHLSKELVPINDSVIEDSYAYNLAYGEKERLFPAVTVYNNPAGGKTIVFSGTPQTEFTYTQAFSMLNAARKDQLIRLLNDKLPLYYPDDSDIYLRAGYHKELGIFCGFFNVSLDTFEDIILHTDFDITNVRKLIPDGSFKECTFKKDGNRITIDEPAYPTDPVILLLS